MKFNTGSAMKASVSVSQDQLIDWLCRLVRIKRVSGNEHEAVEFFKQEFSRFGLQFKQSGRNLLAWRGSGKKTLLFNTHTDTVPANKGWTLDPHDPLRKDGRVHGLGANDAGGCLVGMFGALLSADFDESRATLMFAPTCEEEVAGDGFEKFVHEIPHFDACVTGEPTNCEICIAERGMFKLDLVTKGKSAHAARPWQGVNAAYLAARDILKIEELYEGFTERDELLGRTTLAVVMLNGGVARNVIPSEVKWTVDGRTIPQLDNEATIARVEKALSEHTKIEQKRARFGVWTRSPKDELVQCACKAAPKSKVGAFGGVSDAWWNQKAQGLILGPGLSEQSHAADEWIEEKEVMRGYEIYKGIAEKFLA
ncbi:MAG: hypothetical protein DPW14_15075 [Planctomycetes bacterium]|nr:hypothetical protein [Planctomycetota bacterium]